nr:MAG: hypothetical protein DIU75_09910 [Mycolicibacterium hassiacum]
MVAGDVLIACQVADWGDLPSMSTPTGGATWQLLAQRSAGDEPASYGFSQDSRAFGAVAIVAVQGAKLDITPLVQQSGGTNSSTVTTPSITPAGADDLDIRIAAGTAATWPARRGRRRASGRTGWRFRRVAGRRWFRGLLCIAPRRGEGVTRGSRWSLLR